MRRAPYDTWYPAPPVSTSGERSRVLDVVQRSITDARLAATQAYEDAIEVLYALYRGDDATDVVARGLARYYPQSSAVLDSAGQIEMVPLVTGWLSQLVRVIASTFAHEPSYRWISRSTGQPVEDDATQDRRWRWAREQCSFRQRLIEADKTTTWARTAFLQPAWRRGQLRLDVHRPSMVRVVEDVDDPTSIRYAPCIALYSALRQDDRTIWDPPEALIQQWRYDDASGTYSYHTVDLDGREIPHDLFGGSNDNRYGMHPFVVWRDSDEDGSVYASVDESLLSMALLLASTMSDAAYAMRMGAGGTLFYGRGSGNMSADVLRDRQPSGPGVVWVGDSEDTLTRVDGAADVDGGIKWLEWLLKSVSTFQGLPSNAFAETDQSALAQRAAMWLVDRRRIEDEARRVEQVRDLYRVLADVWNYHRPDQPLRTDVDLQIVPWEPPVVEDRLHTSQALRMEYEDGTLSPVDTLMERYGLSEAEAIDRHKRNVASYRATRGTAPQAVTGDDPSLVRQDGGPA